jgi:hypothetical protein
MFHSEETDVEESWHAGVTTEKLLERTKEFHKSIRAVLKKAEDVKQWPMLFRPPIERWYKDRVVLVGDAAHPMLPREMSHIPQVRMFEITRSRSGPRRCSSYRRCPRFRRNIFQLSKHSQSRNTISTPRHLRKGSQNSRRGDSIVQ